MNTDTHAITGYETIALFEGTAAAQEFAALAMVFGEVA